MTPNFETVLTQAKNLTSAEKARLIKVLAELENEEENDLQDENKVLAELKKIVDERENNPDSQKSARIAEEIRQKNERGYSL